jgi:hypothetical protein
MYKILNILMIAFILSGCSDATPMKITDQYKNYIGVWQLRHEALEANTTKIDNMLLVINSDGTALYRKCQINETRSENSKRRTRFSTNFPTAAVTQITENTITLVQEIGWFSFENKLTIDKAPYLEHENWHINIEGKTLAKLTGENIHAQTNWDCPEDEDG